MIPIFLYVTFYLSYFIVKRGNIKFIKELLQVANIFVLTLVLLNLFNIVPNEIKKIKFNAASHGVVNNVEGKNQKIGYPDIYYIILDEYASLDTIKNVWGYDNSNFKEELENRGFFVTTKSKSKYIDTRYSIASSLNMEYISNSEYELIVYNMINNNKVIDYLKTKGYKTIAFDNISQCYPAKGDMNVDIIYDFQHSKGYNQNKRLSKFSEFLIRQSLARPILQLYIENSPTIEERSTLFTLNKLREISSTNGPKFIYAHIMCPHGPFVFDKNGQDINRINAINWSDKRFYRDQYIFITNQILEVVESIIDNLQIPPVIIIQSDHGPRGDDKFNIPESEKYKIFNAYYTPGVDKDIFYDGISPVNTFRLLFNSYFGDNYQLLED